MIPLNHKYKLSQNKSINRINELIEQHGTEVVNPHGLNPTSVQLDRLRQDCIKKFLFEEYDTIKGIRIVWNLLPNFLRTNDWEKVKKEFTDGLLLLEQYFEEVDVTMEPSEGVDTPLIYQIMRISDETFYHIRKLYFDLIKQKRYEEAYEISILYVVLAPNNIDGWLGIARSLELRGDYLKAIEYYKHINIKFKNSPVSKIMCSWAYLKLGDTTNARHCLNEAQVILSDRPEVAKIWQSVLNKIINTLESN